MSITSPSKQVSLTWKNLSAYAKDKSILNNCEGYCQPGQMLAIMGPSGAGKTTLLSLLSKRNSPTLNVKGDILANGQEFSQKNFYSFGAFVYQNDLLTQILTVRETLQFAAKLKIPNEEEAIAKVDELIVEFELQKTQNTYVGGQKIKGISGGQKKRVCIAIQMVSKPSLIILDEPTSGLDSNKAARVLVILKKLAEHGHTIVFTMHQPSYLQYSKLDRLILLNKGETVYQGPSQKIAQYMKSIRIQIPQHTNISDFFMLQISDNQKKIKENYQTPLNYQNYSQKLSIQVHQKIQKINGNPQDLNFNEYYMAGFFFCYAMLLKRQWTAFQRNKQQYFVLIMSVIVRILLIGVLFLDQIPSREEIAKDPINIFRSIQSCAFNYVAANVMTALNAVALTIPLERQLFNKQTDSKKYGVLPYFLAKATIYLALQEIGTIIFSAASYWLNGWSTGVDYILNFLLISLLATAGGASVGFFCAALFKQIKLVAALTNIVLIPMFVLAGLFNKITSMPVWIRWIQYLSPFRYGFQLYMQNQFRDQKFVGPYGVYDYAEDLGYTLNYTQNFLVLIALVSFFMLLAFLLLKFNSDKMVA